MRSVTSRTRELSGMEGMDMTTAPVGQTGRWTAVGVLCEHFCALGYLAS